MSPWSQIVADTLCHMMGDPCTQLPAQALAETREASAGESSSQPCLTEIILFEYNMLFQQF